MSQRTLLMLGIGAGAFIAYGLWKKRQVIQFSLLPAPRAEYQIPEQPARIELPYATPGIVPPRNPSSIIMVA